jgi:hypothetical protein
MNVRVYARQEEAAEAVVRLLSGLPHISVIAVGAILGAA